jgi:uncharacterized protein (DUF488 family)
MIIYTIGYGGRKPTEFSDLLTRHDVRTVVDVRLRPERASIGCYALAKSPEKGIQGLLAQAGIAYVSMVQLGNVFLDRDDWVEAYRRLLAAAGELLTEQLVTFPLAQPVCLLCAEKNPAACHRGLIATFLERRGHAIKHIV